MIIKKYGMQDLKKAHKLQKDMCDLHIPTPVMSWNYEIKEKDKIIEKGIGKSNSYTRNALNMLSWTLGLCSASLYNTGALFEDGIFSIKSTAVAGVTNNGTRNLSASVYNPVVAIGTDATAENLDSYVIPSASGMTAGSNYVQSVFDVGTRILTTFISRSFTNQTVDAINIVEAGVWVYAINNTIYILMVRDNFTPITVASGQTIVWTYKTEVAYPNP